MTLEDLVDTINAQTSTTNVQASIIQISSNQYEMILSATKDNADITTSVAVGRRCAQTLGVTDSLRQRHRRAAGIRSPQFSASTALR